MASTMSEYKVKMQRIFNYLGGKCLNCNSTETLQIDNIDHFNKSFTIASNWGRSWDYLLPELNKCQLLCKDCHLSKSMSEGSLAKGWTNQPRQTHGTVWSYTKYKCRCQLCKSAKSESMKQYKINKV